MLRHSLTLLAVFFLPQFRATQQAIFFYFQLHLLLAVKSNCADSIKPAIDSDRTRKKKFAV